MRFGGNAGWPGAAGTAGAVMGAPGFAPRFGIGRPLRLPGSPNWLSSGAIGTDAGTLSWPCGTVPTREFIGAIGVVAAGAETAGAESAGAETAGFGASIDAAFCKN